MKYFLEFELKGLPKMANPSNASSTHWRYAYVEARKWNTAVFYECKGKLPEKPLNKFRLVLTRYSSAEPDFDGLVRGFKSVVDGLKKCGVIEDDKLSNSGPWECHWAKAKPREGKITVRVEEVEC